MIRANGLYGRNRIEEELIIQTEWPQLNPRLALA